MLFAGSRNNERRIVRIVIIVSDIVWAIVIGLLVLLRFILPEKDKDKDKDGDEVMQISTRTAVVFTTWRNEICIKMMP